MTNTEQGGRGDINDEAARWKLLPLSEKHVEKLKSSDITATTAGMRGYKTVYNHEELDTYGFVRDLCRRGARARSADPPARHPGVDVGLPVPRRQPALRHPRQAVQVRVAGRGAWRVQRPGLLAPDRREDRRPQGGEVDHRGCPEGGRPCAGRPLCDLGARSVGLSRSQRQGRQDDAGVLGRGRDRELRLRHRVRQRHREQSDGGGGGGQARRLPLPPQGAHPVPGPARRPRRQEAGRGRLPEGRPHRRGVVPAGAADPAAADCSGSPSQPGSPGSSEAPPPPPPYGSIDGAAVLDKVEAWFRRFLRVTFDDDIYLLSLWTAHTHLAGECYTTPRLLLDSLVEGAGKSTVLDHLKRLGHNPVQIASLSSSALLPRLLHSGMRTILLDEVHRTLRPENPGVGDLLAIINTGYRAGATRPVNVPASGGGGGWEVEEMPTFAPVAMAGNDPHLENDTRSRTIRVLLMPDLDGSIEDTDWEYLEDEAQALQEEIAQWSASASSTVKGMVVDLPEGCIGRSKEKWRPLKRIAVAAGGRWPKIADRLIQNGLKEEVAVRAAGLRKQPPGMVLLNDLYAVWPKDKDFMPTIELVDLLVRHHPDYWGDNSPYGRPLNVTRLGTLLNQATNTTSVRPDRHGRRGYTLAAIQPAWTRLGIPPENPEHPANSVNPEQDTDTPDPDCSELAECAECSESYETPTTDSADHAVGNGQDPRAEEDRPMADEFDKLRDRLTKAAENTNQEGVTNA